MARYIFSLIVDAFVKVFPKHSNVFQLIQEDEGEITKKDNVFKEKEDVNCYKNCQFRTIVRTEDGFKLKCCDEPRETHHHCQMHKELCIFSNRLYHVLEDHDFTSQEMVEHCSACAFLMRILHTLMFFRGRMDRAHWIHTAALLNNCIDCATVTGLDTYEDESITDSFNECLLFLSKCEGNK